MLASLEVNGAVFAQQDSLQWSPQAQIPEYDQFTEEPPLLIIDQNHTVHAFNSQPIDLNEGNSPKAIYYRQWQLEKGWSDPIDIIINQSEDNIELMDAYLNQAGRVHLVIQMNNQDNYYSWAPLANAGRATAWSEPEMVGKQAQPVRAGLPYPAAIAGDDQGKLVIVYGGYQEGNGIYAVYSIDDGDSWSEPAPIFLTFDEQLVPGDIQIDLGQSGQLHAVWNFFDKRGFGATGYYSRMDFERLEWSVPAQLDIAGILTPSVSKHDGDLFVTYYHRRNNGNWWRLSSDGGQTWTEASTISEDHVGTNGWVSMVVDSNNILHAFFGQRIDDNNHGMWHSVWQGNGWTIPDAVVKGPQIYDDIGGSGFGPRSARAVISNGNILLVTWGTDGASGQNGAWYSYSILDTPALPSIPLLIPESSTESQEAAIPKIIPSPTASGSKRILPIAEQEVDSDSIIENPMMVVAISLTPVFLLSIILITIKRMRR